LTDDKDIISIQVNPEYLTDIAELIEELNPPSKTKYLILMYGLGVLGGIGLGLFLGWLWVRP